MFTRNAWLPATLAAVIVATSGVATAMAAGPRPAARVSIDPAQLRQDMRKLWSDHVIWTREYIVAALDGSPGAKAVAARLLANQEDIGHAIAGFYGQAAGNALTGLLKQHILIAVDVVAAAKSGNQAGYAAADQKWKRNADEIAAFLSSANPNWPKAAVSDMMSMHLATTTQEVVARLNGKWDDDVKAFDEVYTHILRMADTLTDGIVKQFGSASGQ